MSVRLRKLIGVTIFVIGTILYFLLDISVAFARLPGTALWMQLVFYAVSTLLWFVLAAVIIRWAQKPVVLSGQSASKT